MAEGLVMIIAYFGTGIGGMLFHILKDKITGQTGTDIVKYFKDNAKGVVIALITAVIVIGLEIGTGVLELDLSKSTDPLKETIGYLINALLIGYAAESIFGKHVPLG